jgi:hypothetical protein
MDAWTFDQDRIDRCCTHVIREDGSLDSFCRHYGQIAPGAIYPIYERQPRMGRARAKMG